MSEFQLALLDYAWTAYLIFACVFVTVVGSWLLIAPFVAAWEIVFGSDDE